VVPIGGTCEPGFAPVEDAFRSNFERGELGASCCISVDGQVVVDLWGGWADLAGTRPWQADTIVNAYSVGKPIVALSVLQLVAAGRLDLDAPLTRWWPELRAAQAGATTRHLLCHQGGVPAIREPLDDRALGDWEVMVGALERSEPWWEPGTRHAYHTNTYGHLVGGLARRLDGRLPGTWLRDEVAGPLGADLAWGLGDAELARCAEVRWEGAVPPPADRAVLDGLTEDQAMVLLGYVNPPGYSSVGVVNTDAWRRAQVPSTNLHASARGVCRLYQALATGGTHAGVQVIDRDVLAEAVRPQSEGWCPTLEREVTFGLGFQPSRPDRPFGGPGGFGHYGAGGALGYADPDSGVAFGYVMNAVRPRWQNERNRALVEALHACL
jgi:CubicO group peptidase (beta-lactamase class C family)